MKSAGLTRELIALRVARELRDGMVVNLGIGMPTLVANFIPEGITVVFQAENGLLGYGGIAEEEQIDPDLINAGGQVHGPADAADAPLRQEPVRQIPLLRHLEAS